VKESSRMWMEDEKQSTKDVQEDVGNDKDGEQKTSRTLVKKLEKTGGETEDEGEKTENKQEDQWEDKEDRTVDEQERCEEMR
jgi:hypothetical protein